MQVFDVTLYTYDLIYLINVHVFMIYNLYQQNQLEMNYPSETFGVQEFNVFFSCGSSGTYINY